ncbi:Gfo/Idh/MocA family oxidoreductase [Paenibacillus sp. RC67]|uniref:Gfo/Idh/MocA family protein n=1 Tax=Paenibacillus sp. RC67 TaxID=3039392 RepID=UPI0024AE8156|nr:Gfo/Idh/MocA family oxidoreductase [Paenibacillus sp. RC67]
MRTLKAGVIGTGFIGPAHIEAIRRLGFVEVVGLAASDQAKAEKRAAELGIPHAYSDYREMLLNPEIQVVHNCTPNNLHYQINKDIILSGKHVLSEKPLAVSTEETGELLRLAEESGIVHGVNFNYRQFPVLNQLASMVEQEELGRIHLIHGSYLQDWLLYDTDFNWRMSPETGGKSRAVADIGSHWCDTAQHITGKRIDEVFADLTTVIPIRKKPVSHADTFESNQPEETEYEEVPIRTEDCASVLLRFDDGTKGAFTVSQVSAGRKNRLSIELSGSCKSASWNQEEPEKLWIGYRDKANEVLLADPTLFSSDAQSSIHHPGGHNEGWPDALKNMMLNFYTYIREGKNPLKDEPQFATFREGHLSMCITEAILKSHETGRWVKVIV